MPSRRGYLAGLAAALAGCAGDPTTGTATRSTDATPATDPTPTGPSGVERLDAAHPAAASVRPFGDGCSSTHGRRRGKWWSR